MVAVQPFKRLSKRPGPAPRDMATIQRKRLRAGLARRPRAGVALGRAGQRRVTILGRRLMDPRADPQALLPLLQRRYQGAVARLEQLVNQDSGSFTPAGVNHVADLLERDLRSGGWRVERRAHRPGPGEAQRSEEHTSELQSRENLVCRLLLEKKKKQLDPDTHKNEKKKTLLYNQAVSEG